MRKRCATGAGEGETVAFFRRKLRKELSVKRSRNYGGKNSLNHRQSYGECWCRVLLPTFQKKLCFRRQIGRGRKFNLSAKAMASVEWSSFAYFSSKEEAGFLVKAIAGK
ncbi:MAG: hypothetical protein ACI4QR_02220 [Eubacteriales bacterium]